MSYQQFPIENPRKFFERVDNLEADLTVQETAGLLGTHFYAGGVVPIVTTQGTDTTPVDGRIYLCELRIPQNTPLTGLAYLIGSVGGTNSAIALLFNSAGVLVANSALAGVTVGTTATMQRLPFTAVYTAAPGVYFVGIQMNGTTARIRTQVFGDHDTGSVDQTFGTPVTITPPSAFATVKAPLAMTY